jgi:hypothetical protein
VPWWEELDPDLRADARALVTWIEIKGGTTRVTSVRRSLRGERRIAGPGVVSAHFVGRAFDLTIDPPWLSWAAGAMWRKWGGKWSHRDPIHFER